MSMNNFKLHEQAEKMAAGNSAYELARRVIELEGQLKAAMADNNKIRGRMHDQWIRQNKMKAEAVRGAAHENRIAIGDMWFCAVDDLIVRSNKLERGEV